MDVFFEYLAMLAVILLFVLFILRIIRGIAMYSREMRYINMEIKRTRGSEQKVWIKRKRRLRRRFYMFFFE